MSPESMVRAPRLRRLSATAAIFAFLTTSAVVHAEPTSEKPQWLFLGVQQDLTWMEGDTPCSPEHQQSGAFACFRSNGTPYLGTPRVEDRSKISPGFTPSTTRIFVEYTHFVTPSFGIGGRTGFAVRGGGPRSVGEDARAFFPIHLEARATWSPSILATRSGIVRGVATASIGLAQIDGHARLDVREDPSVPPPASQLDNPTRQTLDVYRKTGTGFGALGAGVVAYVSRDVVGQLLVQGIASFPAPGFSLGLSAGIGFDLAPRPRLEGRQP